MSPSHGTPLSFTSTAQSLDTHLVPRTYLVSNYLTAADVAVYGALRPIFVRRLTPNSLQTWNSALGATTASAVLLAPGSHTLLRPYSVSPVCAQVSGSSRPRL